MLNTADFRPVLLQFLSQCKAKRNKIWLPHTDEQFWFYIFFRFEGTRRKIFLELCNKKGLKKNVGWPEGLCECAVSKRIILVIILGDNLCGPALCLPTREFLFLLKFYYDAAITTGNFVAAKFSTKNTIVIFYLTNFGKAYNLYLVHQFPANVTFDDGKNDTKLITKKSFWWSFGHRQTFHILISVSAESESESRPKF